MYINIQTHELKTTFVDDSNGEHEFGYKRGVVLSAVVPSYKWPEVANRATDGDVDVEIVGVDDVDEFVVHSTWAVIDGSCKVTEAGRDNGFYTNDLAEALTVFRARVERGSHEERASRLRG